MQFAANISTIFTDVPVGDRFYEASVYKFKAVEAQFLYGTDPLAVIIEGKENANNIPLVMMNSPYKPGPLFPKGDYSFLEAHNAALNYATGTKSLLNIEHRDPSEYPKVKGDLFGFACVPGFQPEFGNTIKECVRLCDMLDCRKLHIISGLVHEPYMFDKYEDAYLRNLRWAVGELEEYNIVTLIEPICAETKPNYFLHSFEQAIKYIEEINSDSLKLLLDVYHLYKIEGNVEAGLKKYLPYAGHIQISQSPGRIDPFEAGDIDYARVLDIIKASSYKGYIGLEYFPVVGNNPNFAWIKRYNRDFGKEEIVNKEENKDESNKAKN